MPIHFLKCTTNLIDKERKSKMHFLTFYFHLVFFKLKFARTSNSLDKQFLNNYKKIGVCVSKEGN